jgi:DNA processing protein
MKHILAKAALILLAAAIPVTASARAAIEGRWINPRGSVMVRVAPCGDAYCGTVIEASDKSGSLITAACALEQGREVMAVPGNVLSGRNRGGHALLRDGARIVETAEDVVAELGLAPRAATPVEGGANAGKSTNCKDPVLGAMDAGQPYDLDALAAACGLDVARLLPRISELELRGQLRRLDGGRFIRSA